MADKITFWKGVSAGFLAGMTVAAALRYTPLHALLASISPDIDEAQDEQLSATGFPAPNLRQQAVDLFFQEEPGNAFDPATRAYFRTRFLNTGRILQDHRPVEASHRSATELLETTESDPANKYPSDKAQRHEQAGQHLQPGTDESVDSIALSRRSRQYPRSFDVGSAG